MPQRQQEKKALLNTFTSEINRKPNRLQLPCPVYQYAKLHFLEKLKISAVMEAAVYY